jgi:hypothetical protein
VRLVISIGLLELTDQRFDLAGKLVGKVEDIATPEQPLFKGAEVEARDDAEVVAPAAEGNPEVLVLVGIGVDDLARAEDDLEVDDIVADEALAAGEEG